MRASWRPVVIELLLLRHDPGSPTQIAYRTLVGKLLADEPPDDAAARLARQQAPASPDTVSTSGSTIQVLHSTSWRHDAAGTVTLTYTALPDPAPTWPPPT